MIQVTGDYTREQLEQMPLVEFVDMPTYTHIDCDENGKVSNKTYPMLTYRKSIREFIEGNPFSKIVIYPQGDSLYFGPTTYCPTHFNPIRSFRGRAIPLSEFMYNSIMTKDEIKDEIKTNRKLLLIGL